MKLKSLLFFQSRSFLASGVDETSSLDQGCVSWKHVVSHGLSSSWHEHRQNVNEGPGSKNHSSSGKSFKIKLSFRDGFMVEKSLPFTILWTGHPLFFQIFEQRDNDI